MPHSPTADWTKIPVIDLSSSAPNSKEKEGKEEEVINITASTILSAASTYGFLYVRPSENELPANLPAQMFNLSRKFFSQSDEYKSGFAINSANSGKNMGWTAMGKETLDIKKQIRGDLKEAFNIGEFSKEECRESGDNTQLLPKPLSENEYQLRDFQKRCHALCLRILRYIAIGLEIKAEEGADWFAARHDRTKGPSGSILRFLHYPAISPDKQYDPAVDIRAGAHSDYGSLTLLFQLPGQPGLEIQTPSGEWVPVSTDPHSTTLSSPSAEMMTEPRSLPILANIGDLLSYWTNGLLKSTIHRVVFPRYYDLPDSASRYSRDNSVDDEHEGNARYSMAYFCHPLNDAKLGPLPSKAIYARKSTSKNDNSNSSKRLITAKDHLDERLAATYS